MAEWKKLLSEGNVQASDIASGTLATARIPNLAASKITSGTLGTARIPSLAASKITSGTLAVARIPDLNASKITAGTLPVGRGGTGQTSGYNKDNWDEAYGWGDHSQANYLTSQTDSQTLSFSSGTLSISNGNSVTIPDNNTTYSNSDWTITSLSGFNASTANFLRGDGTWATPPDNNTDTNTQNTYSVSIPSSTTKLRLSGAGHDGSTTDDIEFVGSGATSVTRSSDSKFTISSTNTTYSVQDGQLSQNNFTDNDHSKLDGIAELANRYALSSASFDTSTGVLSIGGNASDGVTVDLDGRYLTSQTDTQDLSISGRTISLTDGGSVTVPETTNASSLTSGTIADARLPSDCGANATYLTTHQDISGKANLSGATFTGTIRTKTVNAYSKLWGHSGGLEVNASTSGYAGIFLSDANGAFMAQLYGSTSANSYGFLNAEWSNWDLRKVPGGKYYDNNQTTYYLQTNSTSNLHTVTVANTISTSGVSIGSTIDAGSHGTSANWKEAYDWGDHSLAGYITSQTDSQTLSISGTTLSISSGNSVTLPDNDTQDLSISGRTISLTNGGSVTVPASSSNDFTSTYQTYASNGNTAHGWGNHALGGYNNASNLDSGTIPDARLPGDCGARTTYDNYSSWKLASSALDSGGSIASGNTVQITGGTGITSSRNSRTIALSLTSGAALSNLGGGSGTTFLRKDGTWVSPQDANTFRTVTAGGNTLGSTETLAFTAGSNVTITESGGAVTISSTDTNTQNTYNAGTGLTLGGGYFAIATGGVTSTHILNNTISASDMNIGGTATTYYPLTFAPTGGGMYWAQIKTVAIEDDAVTTAKINDDAVTNAKMANNAVQGDIIADETIAAGKLADDSVATDNIIDGSITAAKLNSDVNTVYALHFSNQVPVRNGYYYTPNGTYGANYYSWNKSHTSIPSQVTYSGGFYCPPIIVPKAGTIVKWGWHGAFNSSLVGNVSWRLYKGTMTNGGTGSGTLSQVGNTKTVNCSSGRYYEFKDTGLSTSVSEDSVLLPVCNGSASSTKYGRGVWYVVIEYDV